jgi:hypothetical protein
MSEDAHGRLERLGAPIRSLVSEQGTFTVWRPGTGLFVTRVSGHLGIEGAREIDALFRQQVAEDGWNISFNDWGSMENYDSEARVLLSRSTLELLASVRSSHFLVSSRVVAFGIKAANIVLRRLTLHPSEESFQRELSEALAKHG